MLERKCNNCGLIWHDKETDTHCPNCFGSNYETEPVEVLGCPPHCRTTIIEGKLYCLDCGDKLYCVDCGEEIKDG